MCVRERITLVEELERIDPRNLVQSGPDASAPYSCRARVHGTGHRREFEFCASFEGKLR